MSHLAVNGLSFLIIAWKEIYLLRPLSAAILTIYAYWSKLIAAPAIFSANMNYNLTVVSFKLRKKKSQTKI